MVKCVHFPGAISVERGRGDGNVIHTERNQISFGDVEIQSSVVLRLSTFAGHYDSLNKRNVRCVAEIGGTAAAVATRASWITCAERSCERSSKVQPLPD